MRAAGPGAATSTANAPPAQCPPTAEPDSSHVNSLFILLGIESWKPVITALLLPPVPLLLLVLVGARLILPRRGLGWLVVITSVALLWLSACSGTARLLTEFVTPLPRALSAARIAEIKADVQARRSVAIVVLGGGRERFAPEYGVSSLTASSSERLRYGIWLSRQTGAPLAFSGGIGWAGGDAVGMAEAQIAAEIAARDFGRPLKWVESNSRDTRENAGRSIALLKPAGIKRILLVTHGWHMQRSLRNFEMAAAGAMQIEAAPMGLAPVGESSALTWLPSVRGYTDMNNLLREALGRWMGA